MSLKDVASWSGWAVVAITVAGGLTFGVYEVGYLSGQLAQLDIDELRQHETNVRKEFADARHALNARRQWCDVSARRPKDTWHRSPASEIELSIRVEKSAGYSACGVAVELESSPQLPLAQSWHESGRCSIEGFTVPADTGYRVRVHGGRVSSWWELREQCPD